MQRTAYSSGPKVFGTSAKKSWFDEGHPNSPGPAAHLNKRFNQTNPPNWTVGNSTERDSFLQKYHRVYPPPNLYQNHKLDKTHPKEPSYSIPQFRPQIVTENPNKIDEGSSLDYRPKYNAPKYQDPQYSMGYYFERDYSTEVPPPNVYDYSITDRKDFNRTQNSFSVSNRPLPYGDWAKNPGVGNYNINVNQLEGTKYSVGSSDRHKQVLGMDAPGKYYNVGGEMKQFALGKTIGHYIPLPRKKDAQDFPSPDKYNVRLQDKTMNIITFHSQRSQIKNTAVQKYPSPNKYETRPKMSDKVVSFTQQKRYSPEPDENPGVGTYEVQKQLNKTLGNMGLKLKKLTQFIGPSPNAYQPKEILTRPTSQRPINYYSNRVDFSKSVTGAKVGPGKYRTQKQEIIRLGKMSKSLKFQPNRNKNPGPGDYEIPGGIGTLPKYYTNQKKVTQQGFSTHQLVKMQKSRKIKEKLLKQQKKKSEIENENENEVFMEQSQN